MQLTRLLALLRLKRYVGGGRGGLSLAETLAILFFADYWTAGPDVLYSDTVAEIPVTVGRTSSAISTQNFALAYGAL